MDFRWKKSQAQSKSDEGVFPMMYSKTVLLLACRIVASKHCFHRTKKTNSRKKNPLKDIKYKVISASGSFWGANFRVWNGTARMPHTKFALWFYCSLAAGRCSGQSPGLTVVVGWPLVLLLWEKVSNNKYTFPHFTIIIQYKYRKELKKW